MKVLAGVGVFSDSRDFMSELSQGLLRICGMTNAASY